MSGEDIFSKYSWLNSDLFETILNRQHDLIYTIDNFTVEWAFGNGENYSSCLIKANVKYSNGNDTYNNKFIIKTTLGERLIRSRDVFAKEICIYDEIVPKLENVLVTAGILIRLTPKCYDIDRERSYLILEDLTFCNYKNINRTHGLSFSQLKRCLNTLAFWHAASVKLINNDDTNKLYDLFLKPHVSLTGSPHYRTIFENALSTCCHVFKMQSNLMEICRKLNQLIDHVFVKCCMAVERNDRILNVLNHGDLWSNNIMFPLEYDNGLPLFMDFQMCYFGSPILDVSYLIFTSSNEMITSEEYDQLFHNYVEQLIDAMKQLNLPSSIIPSKPHLQNEFELRGCYGAIFSLFVVPMRMSDESSNDDVKMFLDKTQIGFEFRNRIYSNPKVQKLLTILLKYFNKKKFLN